MKKTFLLITLVCSILSSCSNNSPKEDVHEHEDGSTHENHEDTAPATKQEEFTLDSLSSDTTAQPARHSHEDGEAHTH